jgi:hypothetical protein
MIRITIRRSPWPATILHPSCVCWNRLFLPFRQGIRKLSTDLGWWQTAPRYPARRIRGPDRNGNWVPTGLIGVFDATNLKDGHPDPIRNMVHRRFTAHWRKRRSVNLSSNCGRGANKTKTVWRPRLRRRPVARSRLCGRQKRGGPKIATYRPQRRSRETPSPELFRDASCGGRRLSRRLGSAIKLCTGSVPFARAKFVKNGARG